MLMLFEAEVKLEGTLNRRRGRPSLPLPLKLMEMTFQ